MKKSVFISSVLFVFILVTSCQKSELTGRDELPGVNSLPSGQDQKKAEKKKDIIIGSFYGGGIVFFLDETGEHGLIAATENAGVAEWGCMGALTPGTLGNIGFGQQNTIAILEACETPGTAAQLCDSWVTRQKDKQNPNGNGNSDDDKGKKYDDWFLPSWVEAHILLETIGVLRINDTNLYELFSDGPYWTSSQGDNHFMGQTGDGATTAFLLNFTTIPFGEPLFVTFQITVQFAPKDVMAQVRPIRAF